MRPQYPIIWILFVLFFVVQVAWLHRVPGLMGDEASEGENVYQILQSEELVVVGERSYIGPAIDYVRVPFVWLFGYSTLALRIPVLLASVAVFWMLFDVLRRLFPSEGESDIRGEVVFGLIAVVFSPIYLSYQRLGWAITLIPFFITLAVWLSMSRLRHRALLTGLALGLGLHTHVLFLPSLMAFLIGSLLFVKVSLVEILQERGFRSVVAQKIVWLKEWWPSAVGFFAGFGTQLAVLYLMRDDQGDVEKVAELMSERINALPSLLPGIVSGSGYIARYTGMELAPWLITLLTVVLLVLACGGILVSRYRMKVLLLAIASVVQLGVLVYMIDRFTLRYFVMTGLFAWLLAGIGFGAVVQLVVKSSQLRKIMGVGVAVVLTIWFGVQVLIPFLQTGGSTAEFSLGNRTDSAAALVDVHPLIHCLEGAGAVTSENPHIWNRLQYVSHNNALLEVVGEEESAQAEWKVEYRDEKSSEAGELCPELVHYSVNKAQ